MKTKMRLPIAEITLGLFLLATFLPQLSAHATQRTFVFSGTIAVSSIPGVSVGDPFVATLSYDDAQAPFNSGATFAQYSSYTYVLEVAGLTFTKQPGSYILVLNSFLDQFAIVGTLPALQLDLRDNDGSTFSSTALPASLSLSAFNSLAQTYWNTGTLTWGNITSITSCVTDPIVTNNLNDGPGSLRQAVLDACPGSTITFDPAFFVLPQTITLTTGEIAINKNLTITGPVAALSVSGNNSSRVFNISGVVTVTINSLTVTGGNGGGIFVDGSILNLNNSAVSNNSANAGGGIYCSEGELHLTNSTVSGNSAVAGGGGIWMTRNFIGGILTLTNSTVSGNSVTGVSAGGGGILLYLSNATLTNSTLSNNSGGPSLGGGIFNQGLVTLINSIVANSTGGDIYNLGGFVNAEYSLIEDGLGSVTGTNINNLTGDPLLGALGMNGGATPTHALLAGSIAVDKGRAVVGVTTDQRGLTRPKDFLSIANAAVGNGSDIGAFEVQCIVDPIVINSNDAGPGSLRQAVLDACPGSTITFNMNPGFVISPILLSDGQIILNKNLTIQGPGENLLTFQNTAAASTTSRVFLVNSGVTASISGLTISGGNLSLSEGAGIKNEGTLTVTNSTFSGNSTGIVGNGGAIFSDGTLTVSNSTFINNSASSDGGAIFSNGGTLSDCSFSGNSTPGGFGGAIYAAANPWSITRSTFMNNSAAGAGGAIYNANFSATITNSTFTNNSSGNAGGGVANVGFQLTVINCSFFGNTVTTLGRGGALFTSIDGPLTLKNSIVAGSTNGNFNTNTGVPVTDGGGNLKDDNTGPGTITQVTLAQLALSPIANNGGSTQTIALGIGSVAINAGNNANAAGLTTDQRGTGFPRISPVAGTVDVGAYEFAVAFTITTTGTLATFTSCSGTVSAEQTFTVAGTGLTANLIVTAPAGFEVSTTSGSGFATSLSLTQTGGTVNTTTIYVRMAATATGTPSGNITCASSGATTQNVAVNGIVNTGPVVTTNPVSINVILPTNLSFQAAATGTPTPFVQWQRSIDDGQTFLDITGANNTLLFFFATISDDGNQYRAVFSNSCGTATTTAGIINPCTSPQISCPGNQNVNNTPGSCNVVVTYTATATGTPAPAISYVFSGATTGSGSGTGSGSTFNLGVTTVTITATNTCGNPTCSFTVTVEDTEPPVLNVPANTTLQCGDPLPLKPLNINSSPDNLDGTYNFGIAVFGPPLTTTPVTGDLVLVNDGVPNTSNACEPIVNDLIGKIAVVDRGTCTFVIKVKNAQLAGAIAVIVVNNQAGNGIVNMAGNDPSITIPTISVSNNYGNALKASMALGTVNASLSASPVVAADNCSDVVITYTEGATAGNCPGNFSILKTWTATDFFGNSSTASQTITIVDNTAPTLTVPPNITLQCSDPLPLKPININSSPNGLDGTYIFGFAVFGPALTATPVTGNLVLVNDGVPNTSNACEPIVNDLIGKIAVVDRGTCTFVIKVKNAQLAGAIAVIVVNNQAGNGIVNMAGNDPSITIPTISVSNNYGNALKASMALGTVNVSLSASPVIKTDNCTEPVLTYTEVVTPGNCPGNYSILKTWTATDACNNATSLSQTITVIDNTAPTVTVGTIASCYPTVAAAQAAALAATSATDNCPGALTETASTVGTCSAVVTVTTTDGCGNATAVTYNTRIDNTAPTITGETVNPTSLWPPNHKMRDVYVGYSANDNCGTVTTSLSVTSNEPINGTGDGDTAPDWIIGTDGHSLQLRAERAGNGTGRIYTITITATDACGNSSSKNVTVRVTHNITAPVSGNSFKVGSTVSFAGTFWDKPGNTHTGKWLIDGSTSTNAVITEPSGNQNGKSTGSYKFNTPGVYKLQMNITDQTGVTSYANTNGDLEAIVVIYDPNGGYTYGGGWYPSQAGALVSNPSVTGKASYGFTVNYTNATNPKGESQFEFKVGPFEFNALNFDYLVISGAKAQFKGLGKTIINGVEQGGIAFIMTVIDGALDGSGIDKVRMKIFNKTTNVVYYDNQPGASDAANPVTPVGTNSTVVIKGIQGNGPTTKASEDVVPDNKPVEGFEVSAYPNPSSSHYTIEVNAVNTKERIMLQVFDVSGRIVETRNNIITGTVFRLGDKYRPGSYLLRVMQGSEHKEMKLIKLSD